MSKPILFKDGQNSYILPISHANLIQTSTGISVEEKFNTLSQSSKLSFYTSDDCSVDIYAKDDTLNGDYSGKTPIKTWNYTANTQVSLDINLDEHFEINNPNDSIKVIYSWPGVCEKFYDWFMSVNMFCNMIFNFNKMDHTQWAHTTSDGSKYKYGVKEAQYRNCIFWWDVAMTDVNVHCYTLHKTQECPLFYSTIPENTYKTLVEPYNITNNPNFTNEVFLNSMALSDCRSALSYSHTRSVPFGCWQDAGVVTNIIKINGDCRTFMAWSGSEDTATFDCETVTNFGYRLSGGYMYWNAFYECKNLKNLMLKNLKISVNLSWSPISQYSLNYIISHAANESAITIALSPYTWYNLTDSIKTAAANKNITLILGSISNNSDLKIWQDVEGIRNSYLSADNLDLSSYVKWENSSIAPNTNTLTINRLYIKPSSDTGEFVGNGMVMFTDIDRYFNGKQIADYQDGYGSDVRYSFTRHVKGDVAITKDITDAINSYVISASYLTSESDPTVPNYVKSITEQNITDWNNKLSEHQDLSAYVSKTELDLAGYITNLSPRIVEFDENEWAFGGKLITGDGFIDPSTNYVLMADDGELRMYEPGGQTFWKIPFTNSLENGHIVAFQDQIPSLTSYATSANYDSNTKKIYLKHGSTTLSEIDATDFIKDGMVETAYVQGSNLVISFNTDAGKQPVNIPLTDIFNANNYYTKTEINNAGYLQSFTETDPIFTASVAAGIKSTDITNWNSKTSNIGTITGVSMNNTVMGTSGVVNLGTVLTEHQDLSSYVKISDLNAAGYLQSFTETDPTVPSHVKSITANDISNWNSKTNNVGTITGINMNGSSKGTSGVVDLGTVVTTETDPTVPGYVKGIKETDITNWNNAISKYVFTVEVGGSQALSKEDYQSLSTRIINGEIVEAHSVVLGAPDSAGDIYYLQSYNFSGGDYISFINAEAKKIITFRDNSTPTVTSIQYITPAQLSAKSYITSEQLNNAGYLTSFTETDPIFTASAAHGITSSDISNWNSKTSNTGTITGITMNGASKGTSGVVDLGTVLTEHQDLSSYVKWNENYAKMLNINVIDDIDRLMFNSSGAQYLTTNNNKLGIGNSGDTDVISFPDFTGSNRTIACVDQLPDISSYVSKTELNAAGYITSFTESDPTVPTHVKSITQQNITDWNNKLSVETQLSKGTTTGNGNAVTDISVSNHQITLTKGSTFLTAHQDIKTINNNTLVGTGNVTINELPTVSSSDNGKVLQVVNGVWSLVSPVTLYSGSGTPNNAQGNNGDIYLQI